MGLNSSTVTMVPHNINKPYKFFKVNNPGIGAWKYAVLEITQPDTTEPLRVYMANEADLVLEFYTDQERYILTNDQNNNPIPEEVIFTAILRQGGELSESGDDTKTVGEPVTDAIIGIQVTAPDGQIVVGPLVHIGDGVYTLTLETTLLGNYDVDVIASDDVANGGIRNSQYLITTEHSFYVSPYEEPTEFTGKAYIQKALDELLAIKAEFCPSNNNCSWPNKTKKDINNAISYLNTALGYFESNDGNHLKTNKGLNFYDKVTDRS